CNTSATPQIHTLSLHDALPICRNIRIIQRWFLKNVGLIAPPFLPSPNEPLRCKSKTHISSKKEIVFCRQSLKNRFIILPKKPMRSEEHTSELQSRENLVCRLLL